MAKSKSSPRNAGSTAEVLQVILITQLGLAGVPQESIRKIVGCSMGRVNDIVKHLKSAKRSD